MNEGRRAVVGIVERDGKVLLGKKRDDVSKVLSGMWHIPGGIVRQDESNEQALCREIKEETGLEINIDSLFDKSKQRGGKTVSWYLCSLQDLSQDPVPSSDIVDVKFVPKLDVFDFCDPQAIKLWPVHIVLYLTQRSE